MIRNRWLLSSSRVANESVKRICSINENNNIKLFYNLIKCRKPLRPETTTFFLWESSVFRHEQIPALHLYRQIKEMRIGNWNWKEIWQLIYLLVKPYSWSIEIYPKTVVKPNHVCSWAYVPIHIYVEVWQGVLWDIIDA